MQLIHSDTMQGAQGLLKQYSWKLNTEFREGQVKTVLRKNAPFFQENTIYL